MRPARHPSPLLSSLEPRSTRAASPSSEPVSMVSDGPSDKLCICRCYRHSSGSVHTDRSDACIAEGCLLSNRSSSLDASGHMTKETHNAAMSGPIYIITAIGDSAILNWFLIFSLLFSVQDYET